MELAEDSTYTCLLEHVLLWRERSVRTSKYRKYDGGLSLPTDPIALASLG